MPKLDWIGKQAILGHHRQLPCLPLRPDRQSSVGRDTENLLIEGDNLLALKALLPAYAGRVDCIYIDPPYNTGAEHSAVCRTVTAPRLCRVIEGYWIKGAGGKEERWVDGLGGGFRGCTLG